MRETLRRLLRGALLLAGALAALAIVLVLALQAPSIATRVANTALGGVAPMPRATVAIERARLSGVTRLDLTGVRIMRGDTLLVEVESLRAGMRPWALLAGRVELTDVDVEGVRVSSDIADGPPSDTKPAKPGPTPAEMLRGRFYSGPALRLGRLSVHDVYYGPLGAADSAGPVLHRGTLALRDLRLGDGLEMTIDSLALSYTPSGEESANVEARLAARVTSSGFQLDTLRIAGPSSSVGGSGSVVLGDTDSLETMGFRLRAAPLALSDLALFAPGTELSGRIEADVDLSGPRADRFTGSVTAAIDAARMGDLRFGPVRLDAVMNEGAADLNLDLVWEDAHARAEGTARPFDAVPRYDLAIEIDGVPRAFGPGARFDDLAGRVAPRLQASVSGEGYADANLEVDAELTEGTGRVTLTGRLQTRPALQWYAEKLSLEDVDLAPWLGDTTRSAINATLTAQGRHEHDGAMDISGTFAFAPSHYGSWTLNDGKGAVQFDGSTLEADVSLASAYGSAELSDARVDFRPNGPFRVQSLRIRGLDLAGITGDPTLESDLNGTLTAGGRGLGELGSDRARGDAELVFDPSHLRGRALNQGKLTLRLRGGKVDVTGEVETDAGRLSTRGSATPFADPVRADLSELRFAALDLGAWALGPVATELNGHVSGNVSLRSGEDPETGAPLNPLTAVLSLALDPSKAGGLELASGEVSTRIVHDSLAAHGRLATNAGSTAFDADVAFAAGGARGTARFDVPLAVLTALAGYDTLVTDGSLKLHARFLPAGSGSTTLAATLRGSGTIDVWRMDSLFADVGFTDGVLQVDTLALQSNAVLLEARGGVALGRDSLGTGSHITVRAQVTNAAPLRALLGADTLALVDSRLTARLTGSRSSRVVQVNGTLGSFAWNDFRMLDARLEGRAILGDDWQPDSARVVGVFERLRASQVRLDSAGVVAAYDGRELDLHVDTRLDDAHRVTLEATGSRDSGATVIALSAFDAVGPNGGWKLSNPATLRFGEGRFSVDDLELRSDRGAVRASGVIGRSGDENFDVEIDRVNLDFVMAWLGRSDLGGEANGGLTVTGTAARPAAEGDLRIQMTNREGPAAEVDARLDWDGQRADVGAWFASPTGDSLKAIGHVPLAFSFEPGDSVSRNRPADVFAGEIELRITADAFPLSALEPLMPALEEGSLRGTLDSDLRFHGHAQELSGEGHLRLADASIPLPQLGVTYRDVQLDGQLRNDEFTLRQARATSEDGTLELSGRVRFASRTRVEPRLAAKWNDYLFVDTPDMRIRTSADLQIAGTFTAPEVTGNVTVRGCRLQLEALGLEGTDDAADVTLTPEDIRMMEETFGYQSAPTPSALLPIYEASNIDLDVRFGRDNWVRNRTAPRLAMEVTGDVRVRKPPFGEIHLRGSLAPVAGRGYIEHFGRTFDFAGGEVLLNGPMEDHTVDLHTEYKVRSPGDGGEPEVVVHLNLQANAEEMRLVLSSEPALSEAEIISYITTGRNPTKPATSKESGSATDLAADIGLSTVTGALGGAVQEQISLDVLQVRYDAIQGATLVAGRYVDPSLYIGIQQPLQYREKSTNSQGAFRTAVEVDYEAYRWLVLNLQGEASLLRAFVRAHHAY